MLRRLRNRIIAWADDFIMESVSDIYERLSDTETAFAAQVGAGGRLDNLSSRLDFFSAAVKRYDNHSEFVDDKLATLRRDVESLRKQVRELQAVNDARKTPK